MALALVAGSIDKASYVTGTVADIPRNAQGTLDLDDSDQLHFKYGETSFKLPYTRITGFEFENKAVRELDPGFGRAKVWALLAKKKSEVLTVMFQDEQDRKGVLVLELPKGTAELATPVLAARTGKAQGIQPGSEEDAWWGNRYWRTNRNRHLWSEGQK
jgi:hypothetical protein